MFRCWMNLRPLNAIGLAHLRLEHILSSLVVYSLARMKAQWGRPSSLLTKKVCHLEWVSSGITLVFIELSLVLSQKLVCSRFDYLGEALVTRECQVYGLLCLFFFFNWNIVGLQCCVSFRYTAKWFNCTYIFIFSDCFPLQVIIKYWV